MIASLRKVALGPGRIVCKPRTHTPPPPATGRDCQHASPLDPRLRYSSPFCFHSSPPSHPLSCSRSSPVHTLLFSLTPLALQATRLSRPHLDVILIRSPRLLSEQCWVQRLRAPCPSPPAPNRIPRRVPGLAIRDQSCCLAGLRSCTGTFDPDSGLGGTMLPSGKAVAGLAMQLGLQGWYPFLLLLSPHPAAPPYPPHPNTHPELAESKRREVWPTKELREGGGARSEKL